MVTNEVITDGDFASEEVTALRNEADIICTNPPFSCYSDDTQVLTAMGWKLFKDVVITDKILSMNPSTLQVEYADIVRLYKKDVNEELYHFKKRGMDLLVTANHRMICNQAQSKFCTADKIKQGHTVPVRGFNYVSDASLSSFILPACKQNEQYSRKEVEVPEKVIDMGNWLEFFGFWLADGCCRTGNNSQGNPRYTVSIKQRSTNAEYVKQLYNNIGFTCKEQANRSGNNNYTVYSKQLWLFLSQFGKSTTKYIPREWLNLNKDLLSRLLTGYLHGDAHITSSHIHIGSVSPQLCDDLAELILKVEGRVINFIPKKSNGSPYKEARWSTLNLSRENIKYPKPEKIIYTNTVYCAELNKNHTMLVRRNGVATWCGNCFRDFLRWINPDEKKFLILGNMNAITYKEVFPLIRDNKVWLGASSGSIEYSTPNGTIQKMGNTRWFTNLNHRIRREELQLLSKSVREQQGVVYQKYDNYDAIEVPKTKLIPSDYDGVMGVPISFLDKYNPDQFEIIGNEYDLGLDKGRGYINGVRMYSRIFIKNK